eukprot:364902-Chlamydomonas_euryale.AAC.1
MHRLLRGMFEWACCLPRPPSEPTLRTSRASCCSNMLTYIESAVTRNASEKKINSLLDFMAQVDVRVVLLPWAVELRSRQLTDWRRESLSLLQALHLATHAFFLASSAHLHRLQAQDNSACSPQATDVDVLQQFYETTLKALERAKNDRLWFKTNLKLANLWFKKQEYPRLSKILKELLRSCQVRLRGRVRLCVQQGRLRILRGGLTCAWALRSALNIAAAGGPAWLCWLSRTAWALAGACCSSPALPGRCYHLHAPRARVAASLQRDDGSDDPKKGTQLLDIYALEIQMYTEQRNNKKLKQLYNKALGVKSAIPHPRIMGIVRECGGKMHMSDELWSDAATDFFEAFKSYDEAGVARRVQCLKYLVLASMLMESKVRAAR